ncbi:MAG: hypothetical protein HY927_05770 [Elusimicrobia bacterium]|nr:hypothetical protein [Elusimicrobiota bacterium]
MKASTLLITLGIAACASGANAAPALLADAGQAAVQLPTPHSQTILASQDPLTRQIISQLTKENGGVKAVVRIASGQGVEMRLGDASSLPAQAGQAKQTDLAAIPAITPDPELAKQSKGPARKRKPIKKASEQLKAIEKQSAGWGEGAKASPKKPDAPVEIY